jgi:uncharacterized protein (DUF1330 family)
MHLTNQILAPKENFVDFIKNYPSQTPLWMVNLLKFKDQMEDGRTGEEGYNTYIKHVNPLLAKVGGKTIWSGKVMKTVIGDYTTQPDRILVVYYPSKEAFIEMSISEEYAAIGHHRHLSLEYGGLIATEMME